MLLHNIPIIHNSIFLYQLDIRKNYNKIFEKQKIKQEANGFLTYSSTEYNILNEFKDLKKECEKSVGSLITDKLSFKDNNFKIFNSWITKQNLKVILNHIHIQTLGLVVYTILSSLKILKLDFIMIF